MEKLYDVGLIGIAVMGENLALNMSSKGFSVVVSSRKQDTIDTFLNGRAKGKNFAGTTNMEELVSMLKKPRKIMLMIKAGNPVDQVIEQLIPLLDEGDVIIDGGNSNYEDTTRRTQYLKSKNILYVGSGVSGGEEGALIGPSIMPGGNKEAWPIVKPLLQSIAAKVNDGQVCCDWVGEDGAGHFVKMVHNGIEYGDIQLITEIYHIMKSLIALNNDEMSTIFSKWNQSELDSYLIEITADILAYKDERGQHLIDKILDTAGQKGTGKWTVSSALEEGIPLTLIGESVFSRFLSALKEERVLASKLYPKSNKPLNGNKNVFIEDLRKALYGAKILSYTQGYQLMKAAAESHEWNLNYGGIALMWRGGCIIRSVFLDKIKNAFDKNPNLSNLLLDDYFINTMEQVIPSLRKIVSTAVLSGIPVPALSSALAYFDGYTSHRLPANLLQAQRDYFGAHTYERVDQDRGIFFHTNWTGKGGKTSSTTYNV
ncbi:decarboxylating NADP(+)-dependent phosphogluconate dehydrogenase [Hujiaoplasma nucleasis]|uniref:6-phosphogluconate dehydrogenase, decarboxylating n=1 Tax=Hujiaoplasma nucleasis TaxID=2725268 RepID=A0A7L6N5K1_9MOLU|nr:decarboxylating NADP(+)-dependent phosphogluconate dehydrogenase [Hujiaoplasma nucleasis]QLY40772.1 decarboxylating NADP(+)-dependent phosphogluconate dehydrogenase [Hujiaoplasma nucleasis]